MQIINFDRTQDIPIVDAIILGPITHERVRLVFDSGCGLTQIDKGYVVGLESFKLFGYSISNLEVGVYDFDNFAHFGIDGLLGFDLIKQMHFELNGPQGLLKIFDISA